MGFHGSSEMSYRVKKVVELLMSQAAVRQQHCRGSEDRERFHTHPSITPRYPIAHYVEEPAIVRQETPNSKQSMPGLSE